MFFQSIFVGAFLVGIATNPVHAQIFSPFPTGECARNYTVVSGDTCDGISAKTKTSVSTFQLADVNKNKIDPACDNLFIGEVLCLGIRGQDCQVVHVVQLGDTCEAIAQAAGTTLDILFANNPNVASDCTNIYTGEVLCTADEVIVSVPDHTTTMTGSDLFSTSTVKTVTLSSTIQLSTTSTARSTSTRVTTILSSSTLTVLPITTRA
ncbi:hypothetical protein C8Q74DRAFT_496912 [Fomes fomentarius]|nr:hypothetical protein C8Q74DRAFT_496912 [Fomes fomentarius]